MADEIVREWDASGRLTETRFAAPPARQVTPLEFMARLPAEKQAAIAAAALQSPPILLLLLRLAGATAVNLDAPETVAGVAALRQAGLLTADEARDVQA